MMSDQNILNINKPAGLTSFDVVKHVSNVTGAKKVGHAGTLDPSVTGLLIILVSRQGTRQFRKFLNLTKTYPATFHCGASTDTHDITGENVNEMTCCVSPGLFRSELTRRAVSEYTMDDAIEIDEVENLWNSIAA